MRGPDYPAMRHDLPVVAVLALNLDHLDAIGMIGEALVIDLRKFGLADVEPARSSVQASPM